MYFLLFLPQFATLLLFPWREKQETLVAPCGAPTWLTLPRSFCKSSLSETEMVCNTSCRHVKESPTKSKVRQISYSACTCAHGGEIWCTLQYSNVACWKIKHLVRWFSLWNLHFKGFSWVFQLATFDYQGVLQFWSSPSLQLGQICQAQAIGHEAHGLPFPQGCSQRGHWAVLNKTACSCDPVLQLHLGGMRTHTHYIIIIIIIITILLLLLLVVIVIIYIYIYYII